MRVSFRIRGKLLRIVPVLMVAVLVIALLLFGIQKLDDIRDQQQLNAATNGVAAQQQQQQNKQQLYYQGKPYQLKEDVESVLLIGLDKFEEDAATVAHRNDQQSDVVMLMVIDHQQQKYTMLNINRDTMVRFNTVGINNTTAVPTTAQLALAHTYYDGKLESSYNVRDAVKHLLYDQIKIAHVLSMKMDGVAVLNDAVGGVSLELLDDFTAVYNDERYTKGAQVTLLGDQALDYVRARGELDQNTNEDRMKRQSQYIANWRKAFFNAKRNDDALEISLLDQLDSYIVTNIDSYEVGNLTDAVERYESDGIITLQGKSEIVDGYMQFHPDDAALQQLVIDLFYEPVPAK